MIAEDYKTQGNQAVSQKKWAVAEKRYSSGIECLRTFEKDLHVQLLSNRALVRIQLGKFNEALEDAEAAIKLDPKYDKAYIRKTSALEALKLKRAINSDDNSCPVLACFRAGLAEVPTSTLLVEAMKLSFPWLKNVRSTGEEPPAVSKKKKYSNPTKEQRESCESVDIRGAIGPHELRINGIYYPTDEIIGGWPVYRKKTDDDGYGDDDDIDEDDNMVLEFQSGLNEWMIKHTSCKGTHRSFIHCKALPNMKPEDCKNAWQGMEDKKIIIQHTLSVVTERRRKEMDTEHFGRVRSDCPPVEVRGATGRKAAGINGVYEPTDVNCGGWPVYMKVSPTKSIATSASSATSTATGSSGEIASSSQDAATANVMPEAAASIQQSNESNDQKVWLEYNAYFKSWQIKPSICLNTNRSWAYVVANDHIGQRPEQCHGIWDVLDDNDFRPQESITLLTVQEWAEDDRKSKECWANASVLNIRGATGVYASLINGIYEPQPSFDGGYRKRTDISCVIEYNRKKLRWQIRAHSSPFAMVSDIRRVTPDHCLASWSIFLNGSWEIHPNLSVMTVERRKQIDLEKYGDKLSKACPLDVRGAIGVNAFKINGVYEPTQEIAGGWPVYQRKGSFDYWLEFNAERENWQIKSAANRGMDSAFAYVDASPPCSPELCAGPWWVYTGSKSPEASNGWEKQPSVTMLTVERRVIEDMKLFELRRASCIPVDIRGAGGPRSNGLNGVFVPTNEMHGGWPVYQKRDDPDWWLEYDACPQKWMVRPTPCRGTTRGRAYILCDPNLRPELAKGLWRMSDGKGGWAIEPNIFVRPESVALEEDRVKFAARRATAVAVDLRGVSRPMSYINGVYEPTNESCYGWPVYKKQSSDNQWLEYHLPSKEWQIKPTSCKGTKKNWAYITSDPTHPELCTDTSWMVLVGGKHLKQEGVTLVSLEQRAQEDKILADQRRPLCTTLIIMGAEGPNEKVINGRYEPSPTKSCGGWPSYFRQSVDSRSLLEFNIYAMSWTITAIRLKREESTDAETPSSVIISDPGIVTDDITENNPTAQALKTVPISKSSIDGVNKLMLTSPPSLVSFVEVSKFQRPDQTRDNVWKILGDEKFEPQASVSVLLVSALKNLRQSIQEELDEYDARMAKLDILTTKRVPVDASVNTVDNAVSGGLEKSIDKASANLINNAVTRNSDKTFNSSVTVQGVLTTTKPKKKPKSIKSTKNNAIQSTRITVALSGAPAQEHQAVATGMNQHSVKVSATSNPPPTTAATSLTVPVNFLTNQNGPTTQPPASSFSANPDSYLNSNNATTKSGATIVAVACPPTAPTSPSVTLNNKEWIEVGAKKIVKGARPVSAPSPASVPQPVSTKNQCENPINSPKPTQQSLTSIPIKPSNAATVFSRASISSSPTNNVLQSSTANTSTSNPIPPLAGGPPLKGWAIPVASPLTPTKKASTFEPIKPQPAPPSKAIYVTENSNQQDFVTIDTVTFSSAVGISDLDKNSQSYKDIIENKQTNLTSTLIQSSKIVEEGDRTFRGIAQGNKPKSCNVKNFAAAVGATGKSNDNQNCPVQFSSQQVHPEDFPSLPTSSNDVPVIMESYVMDEADTADMLYENKVGEDDDDLFEAIRSAQTANLDENHEHEHPFPLSDQYFDSLPNFINTNSSLADFSDDFFSHSTSNNFSSITFSGPIGGIPVSTFGLPHDDNAGLDSLGFRVSSLNNAHLNSVASITGTASSMASSVGTSGEASEDSAIHGLYGQNSKAIQHIGPISIPQVGLTPPLAITPQSNLFSPSNVIGHQPSSHFQSQPSNLSSPSFNSFSSSTFFTSNKSLKYSSPPQTDQLSTSTSTYVSNDFQGWAAAAVAAKERNPELNQTVLQCLNLSLEPIPNVEMSDPNPILIKESDLLVETEYALDQQYGESIFPAYLWGRSVTVRKLHQSHAPGHGEVVNANGDKLRLDFLRELQVLTDFRHVNILPLQGFSFWPMILVYPFVPERLSLSQLFANSSLLRNMYWTAKLRVISTVSSALAYIHYGCPELSRPGIVHRCIHPGTIFISVEDGDALLTDFRQSRDLDKELSAFGVNGSATKCSDCRGDDDWLVGLSGYVDPSYLQSRIYTPFSDLYSVGVLLLQLLLGETQYDSAGLDRTIRTFLFQTKKFRQTTWKSFNPLNVVYSDVLTSIQQMMSIDSGMWPRTTILHVARIISLFLYLPHEDALQRERVETTAEFLSSCLVDIANEIIADTATTGAGSLMTHTQASSVSR